MKNIRLKESLLDQIKFDEEAHEEQFYKDFP